MCVAWRDRKTKKTVWCALDGKLDPQAVEDTTRCNHTVLLRIGSERRAPTCPDCLKALRKDKP